MTDTDENNTGICDQCGRNASGKRQLMFYPLEHYLLGGRLNEFICDRCLRRMRVYRIIGLSLFAIIILAIIVTYMWVTRLP